MYKNDCLAMILAGGRGERLGALTRYYAKPAVHFGGCGRIIDFTLNNCRNSKIDTVGILTQHFSDDLHAYVSTFFNSGKEHGRMHMLSPEKKDRPYVATADAVYQNIEFIDRFRPEHVLILAGDHIYRMDYSNLIAFHKQSGADVTIAAKTVPLREAFRYGILKIFPDGRINEFEEKPSRPKSNLASMGIYVFKWKTLRSCLTADSRNPTSRHDFGKDIIPAFLDAQKLMCAYQFDGYWRDVGTLDSLWEAHMDLLAGTPELQIPNQTTGFMSVNSYFKSAKAEADRSIISEDCMLFGNIRHSVLADSVTVGRGAEVVDSIVMPGAYIGENAKIYKTIVGTRAKIMDNAEIGADIGISAFIDQKICRDGVSLVAPWSLVPQGMKFQKNSQIYGGLMQSWENAPRTTAKGDFDPRYSISISSVSRQASIE